jgi:hypothetical protein
MRRVLLAIVAVLGCRASEAGPGSGLAPPAGWQAAPQLAAAASDAAKADGAAIEGSEAWADQARGCYGAWLAWRGGSGAPDQLADALILAVSSEKALDGIVVREVVKPTPGGNAGVLSFGFDRPAPSGDSVASPYRGTVRAQLTHDGHVAALACFWNQREPAACESDCAKLVGSMK